MRSKTLLSYQKGYCGQPADIEAMKPREARAYCLGVGHVAAGTLPLGSGAEVLAALTTRRRDVLGSGVGDGKATTTTMVKPFTAYDYVELVRSADLGGEETRAHAWHLAASGQNCFRVLTRTPDYLRIALRDGSSVLVNAADFAPVSKDSPR
jgi:hypothetical protein